MRHLNLGGDEAINESLAILLRQFTSRHPETQTLSFICDFRALDSATPIICIQSKLEIYIPKSKTRQKIGCHLADESSDNLFFA